MIPEVDGAAVAPGAGCGGRVAASGVDEEVGGVEQVVDVHRERAGVAPEPAVADVGAVEPVEVDARPRQGVEGGR